MELREAAEILGVHYQTAYGWVRQGVLPARKGGRGYDVLEADVQSLARRRAAGQPPRQAIRIRDWAAQCDRLFTALAAGDEPAARQRVARLAEGGVPLIDLCARIIGPALRKVGDEWAAGRLTVAAEHRASVICERLIALWSGQPGGRPRGVAVVTTPAGERHGLPALMAASCLRQERWHVHHADCDLPLAEVSALARGTGASLIVLSAATAGGAASAVAMARELAAAVPGCRALAGQPGDSLYDLLRRAAARPGPADRAFSSSG
jgi:excisionase family DNA binding protein